MSSFPIANKPWPSQLTSLSLNQCICQRDIKTLRILWSRGADREHPHGAHNSIKCVDVAVHSPTDCHCRQRWVQQDQILSHPGLEMVSSGPSQWSCSQGSGLAGALDLCSRKTVCPESVVVSAQVLATPGLTAASSRQRASQAGGPVL